MTKSRNIRPRRSDSERQKMAALYKEGYSRRDIGIMYGVSEATIGYHLKKIGVPQRKSGVHTDITRARRMGANHHNWKGGRKKNRNGYIEIRAAHHPNSYPSGYILEHRLIMENYLVKHHPDHDALTNGLLDTGWVVHHKNGDKTDNRIKNLEIMPRNAHHSWIHYHDEIKRLKSILDKHGIPY